MSKVIKLPFNDSQVVSVGWTGQNEYEEVTFDISKWLKKFPNGVVRVFYRLNSDGNLYPIADITTSTYIWKPQAADFPRPGRYSAQAIMESGTTIGKSDIFYFDIKKSLDHLNQISDDPPPEYPPSYIQKIMQDMEAYAQRAESAAEHIPYYKDGKLYIWDEETEQFVEFSLDIDTTVEEKVNQYFETHDVLTEDDLDGAINDALAKAKASGEFDGEDGAPGPQGEPGKDGKDGQDGAQGPQGIPGKDGADGAPGKDGKDGAQGPAGQDGTDGYSPTVAVESITGGNRITITDKNGPHSIDVMNGTTLRVAMTAQDTAPTLDSNKLYVFPEMASLEPTFATPTDSTIVNEYHFIFDSGSTATVLTLPATILQPDGFTVEANTHYEVSILEGAMTAQGWAVTV